MKRGAFGAALLFGITTTAAFAQEAVELETIVVTPNRYEQDVYAFPGAVEVVTEDEIEQSHATTLPELLKSETGLQVSDYYGTGAKAIVDLRGFGETATSNVLVLVDGRRVNEIDLSGVDWTQISLDQVERVEILHGSGSVLYGDNAQGAVINIITKKGKGKPRFTVGTSGGSYRMNKQSATLDGSLRRFNYSGRASRMSTNGYRQNSYYDSQDLSGSIGYEFTGMFSLSTSGSYHHAVFGLPGPLSEADLAMRSRRDSKYPDDDVGEEDGYIMVTPKFDFQDFGELEANAAFRRRSVANTFGTYGLFLRSGIDTISVTPKYNLRHTIFSKVNEFIIGTDYYDVELLLNDYTNTAVKTGHSSVNKHSLAFYAQDTFSILDQLLFEAGYRWEHARYDFDYNDLTGMFTDIDDSRRFNEQAWKAGLTYQYGSGSKAYTSLARGYRLPVVDEFILYNFWVFPFRRYINDDLQPQRSLTAEAGVEHGWTANIHTGLNVFWMKTDDEIYYDPYSYVNGNYDTTQRTGLELKADARVHKMVRLFGNYSYTRAVFDDGDYKDNEVPFVPRYRAAAGIDFTPIEMLSFTAQLNYTGSRYFISDFNNAYGKMDDYITVDLRGSCTVKFAKIYAGVNNLADEMYSEVGVVSVFSGKNYYPSPGRNFYAGVSFDF